jgi:hypothetical protein
MESFRFLFEGSAPYCSGYIEFNPILFYEGLDNKPYSLHFPLTQEEIDSLIKNTTASPFGKGTELVYDKDFRFANELLSDKYAITLDPYYQNIISTIEDRLAYSSGSIRAEPYKLNIYPVGGRFKMHKDTPRSENMIGTLVVCLASEFTGGEFILYKNGYPIEFNWATESSNRIQWNAFYGDLLHEIKEVTSGYRITLTYNLYYSDTKNILSEYNKNVAISTNLINDLHKFLKQFATKKIGFGCEFMYSGSQLKGNDDKLFNLLKQLGLNPKVKRIITDPEIQEDHYQLLDDLLIHCKSCKRIIRLYEPYWYSDEPTILPSDEYSDDDSDNNNPATFCSKCVKTNPEYLIKHNLIPTCCFNFNDSDVPHIYTTQPKIDKTESKIYNSEHEGYLSNKYERLSNIYWLISPVRNKGEFEDSEYFCYGNGPDSKVDFYSNCVIIVKIPTEF